MTDAANALTGELVTSTSALVAPEGSATTVAAPLLPAAERYAASQAAPTTTRTYRSTLRSFALFCEHELGLPATVEAVTLDTVLDYTAWLQDVDEETTSRVATRARSPSSSRRYANSRAGCR